VFNYYCVVVFRSEDGRVTLIGSICETVSLTSVITYIHCEVASKTSSMTFVLIVLFLFYVAQFELKLAVED
jgi:hypothetical protein